MRLHVWTVRAGPAIVVAAVVPTLLGALMLSAPNPAAIGGAGAEGAGAPAGRNSSESTPRATAKLPATMAPPTPLATASAADASAGMPCTPLRGTSAGARSAAAMPFQVDGLLSPDGEQIGRRLSVRARSGTEVTVHLPSDSFVAQPSGDWLVYGVAGRRTSDVRAIDLVSGCDTRLARVVGVARGAALSADGTSLFVHTVDAAARRDMGVMRVDLASGRTDEALPPFAPTAEFGRVFATTLAWSLDGATLAVQSCGGAECHTRLLDVAAREITSFTDGHGVLVAVTARRLVAFAAGHERPAPLLAIDRRDGSVAVIVDEAYDTELADEAGEPLLLVDTPAGWQEIRP